MSAPRYREPRILLRWDKNNRLKVLKMLAAELHIREHISNPDALEARIDAVCEPLMREVLGEAGVTLAAIREHTLKEQGALITASKLMQRADKTYRFLEVNEFYQAVGSALSRITEVR